MNTTNINWMGIQTFGIITVDNPEPLPFPQKRKSKYFTDKMKRDGWFDEELKGDLERLVSDHHLINFEEQGVFNGQTQSLYFIINPSQMEMSFFCRFFRRPSYIFCEIENKEDKCVIHSRYYEIADRTQSAYPKSNQYLLKEERTDDLDDCKCIDEEVFAKGNTFSCSFPLIKFAEINNRIIDNFKRFENNSPDEVLDICIRRVGIVSWYWRGRLYKGMLKKATEETEKVMNHLKDSLINHPQSQINELTLQ